MPPSGRRTDVAAIIPLKAIAAAKTRLATSLSAADRALLLRRTFDRVITACRGAGIGDVLVVVGCARGRGWARDAGADSLDEPNGAGLNGAIAAADGVLGDRPSLVLPADLPLVTADDLRAVLAAQQPGIGVVVVPTADGGTGALLRTPGGVIAPRFGPGSAAAHHAAAAEAGVPSRLLHLAGLALDLDRPQDIVLAGGWAHLSGTLRPDGRVPHAPDRPSDHDVEDPMPQGTIKTFDPGTRSGSLVLDDLTEVRYDAATFESSRLMELRVGQRVRFELDGTADARSISNLQIVSL